MAFVPDEPLAWIIRFLSSEQHFFPRFILAFI